LAQLKRLSAKRAHSAARSALTAGESRAAAEEQTAAEEVAAAARQRVTALAAQVAAAQGAVEAAQEAILSLPAPPPPPDVSLAVEQLGPQLQVGPQLPSPANATGARLDAARSVVAPVGVRMQVRGLEPFLSPPRLLLEFMDAVQVEAVYDGDTGQRLEVVLVFPRGAAAARVRTNSFGCTLAPAASPRERASTLASHRFSMNRSFSGRQPHAARRPGPTHGVDARHGSQGGPGAGVRKGVRGGRDLTVMSLRPQLLTPPTCSDDRLSVDGECRAGRREGGAPLGCTDSSRSVCMQGGGVPRHAALGCSSPRPPTTRGQRLRGCKRGVAMCSGCETLVSLLSMICCTPVFSGAPSRVCAVA